MTSSLPTPAAGRGWIRAGGRLPFLAVGIGVFLADQISKGWAQRLPEQVAGGVLVPHLLEVFPVRNPGIAFSLFAGFDSTLRMGLAFVSALVLLLVAWMALRRPATSSTLAGLALILGGAGGNLMDRVLFGRVTDFLLVTTGTWNGPIFNVADAAITGGAILLIWDILRTGPAIDGSEDETAASLLASHSHPPGGGPSPSPSLPGVAPLPPDCE